MAEQPAQTPGADRPEATTYRPETQDQLVDLMTWAASADAPLDLGGTGSKRALGRPMQTQAGVSLTAFTGIQLYEPEELILKAGAGTPLDELVQELANNGQAFAFEPPDLGPLLGADAGQGTLGGTVACNLAGPRRIKAGAARDHFLGYTGVSGRGEVYKSGGRVVKNVTGYDLCKLMAGSYGTLTAMTDIRDVRPFVGLDGMAVWRISVPPAQGPDVAARLSLLDTRARYYLDWGGGLIWLAVPEGTDAFAEGVRGAVAPTGGHATLIKAAEQVRAQVPVFQPQDAGLAALTRNLKDGFDPKRLLNPGRMYAGV
jgi:FAD/FMN-containing dehydrogenase